MPSIINLMPGSKPIASPDTASHRQLADRFSELGRQAYALDDQINELRVKKAALNRESRALTPYMTAAISRELDKIRRAKRASP